MILKRNLKVWYNYRHILERVLQGGLEVGRIENRSSSGRLASMLVSDVFDEVPLDLEFGRAHVTLDGTIRVCLQQNSLKILTQI